MKKPELIAQCKSLGIKGIASKSKDELIKLLADIQNQTHIPVTCVIEPIEHNPLYDVLTQLTTRISKDPLRKVCKQCNELGHGITSVACSYNIHKNKILTAKIKRAVLSNDALTNVSIDDQLTEIGATLGITPNFCKTLYNEIPCGEMLNRTVDIQSYINHITNTATGCSACEKPIICIQSNTSRIWKNAIVCETCWCSHAGTRAELWNQLRNDICIVCEICNTVQRFADERFHYDHINMFDKCNSICSMVNEGCGLATIKDEIAKCQILCVQCHHIITDIERKIGFTRIKSHLTRTLNAGDIAENVYSEQQIQYQEQYRTKMKEIYMQLKTHLSHS